MGPLNLNTHPNTGTSHVSDIIGAQRTHHQLLAPAIRSLLFPAERSWSLLLCAPRKDPHPLGLHMADLLRETYHKPT